MEPITLMGNDDQPIFSFYGQLLAQASSMGGGKERWSDLALYAMDGTGWVVHSIGRSSVPGEVDKHKVKSCPRPEDVLDALRVSGIRGDNGARAAYMTRLGVDLLGKAMLVDERLVVSLVGKT